MIDIKALGQRVRQAREMLGLSRQEFAELVALSEYYIGQIERGERQMSLAVLADIATCLHLSTDYIVFGIEDNHGYVQEDYLVYKVREENVKLIELNDLFYRCSAKEQELIIKLVKTIIPYLEGKPNNQ